MQGKAISTELHKPNNTTNCVSVSFPLVLSFSLTQTHLVLQNFPSVTFSPRFASSGKLKGKIWQKIEGLGLCRSWKMHQWFMLLLFVILWQFIILLLLVGPLGLTFD
ncbi:unnamed protein product [Lathyrus sativus]|nr:unnamed protein product [Lathyrus sativus]